MLLSALHAVTPAATWFIVPDDWLACSGERIKLKRRSATDQLSEVNRLHSVHYYILMAVMTLTIFACFSLSIIDVCVKCIMTQNVLEISSSWFLSSNRRRQTEWQHHLNLKEWMISFTTFSKGGFANLDVNSPVDQLLEQKYMRGAGGQKIYK